MLWFLVLHIIALLFWCAALLYLPALIASNTREKLDIRELRYEHNAVARYVFVRIATPAALLAIIAGTLVFLINRTIEVWLIAKLTLVTGLVICHAFSGLLILRAEHQSERRVHFWCCLLGSILCVLMTLIVWMVLAKPMRGEWV
ncbi:CopD family protein [Cellvibrio sp. ARAG 10.3]|uniref:CopD family protein n=1 Tax=Cellvibrio sp. ARAG 10.3 TaxID=3451358 RepID=UPI003F44A29B